MTDTSIAMKEKLKKTIAIVGYSVLILVIIAGCIFGPEELRTRMLAATILAAVTGAISILLGFAKGGTAEEKEVGSPSQEKLSDKNTTSITEVEADQATNISDDKEENVSKSSIEPIPAESLRNLKELHDKGVFSDEEFAQKKKKLLGL